MIAKMASKPMSLSNSQRLIQDNLSQAQVHLDNAQKIADDIGEPFSFNGQTYRPRTVIDGHWEKSVPKSESWISSNDEC